jgi:hypothetical protein
MNRCQIVFIVMMFALTSCHLPGQTMDTPPLRTPLITDTPTSASATPTRIPIETLLARATPTFIPTPPRTPRLALAAPINQPVNCRYGPSTAYAIVGGLEVGRQAEIVGKNSDVTWWYVKNPSDPSTFCWLAASLIEVTGTTDALPVVSAPPAQVSDIQISADPPSLNVSCEGFPQYVTVNAVITTNGPTNVTFRWETSEGEVMDADLLLFLEASSKGVFLYYKVKAAKDYWFQIHILSPNDATGRDTFKATCAP